jgi:hypothetical protein
MLASDELDHERLARGDLERLDDARDCRERDQPRDSDASRQREPPERQRFDEEQGLRDRDEAELVRPVDQHARGKRQQHDRQ